MDSKADHHGAATGGLRGSNQADSIQAEFGRSAVEMALLAL
jgi:hypothetical protein